jgi:ferric-dicitrate binding protein FerR (iron transport regulator)
MEHEEIKSLLERYLSGECTSEERIWVEQWYRQLDIHSGEFSETKMEEDIAEIRDRLSALFVRRMAMWYRWAAAVVIFAVVSAGIWFYVVKSGRSMVKPGITDVPVADIMPGRDRAILELTNGTEIALDNKPDGEIARDGKHAIYKNADGELTYQHQDDGKSDTEKPVLNTLRTPRGGQYHLVLPDGTKVWLNAASTLTYTISKSGNERLVKLEGEACFEVAKDINRPFRVESRGQVAEVLGTQFNINCYPDEPNVKTTLVEGSVNVVATTKQQSAMLTPGQQATLDADGRLSVKSVNVDHAIAWKNGKFSFNQSDIGTVMRQLSRWYDVEVVFNGKIPDITLSGEIYRNTNASHVLEILSFYNLDCRIETTDGASRIVIQ